MLISNMIGIISRNLTSAEYHRLILKPKVLPPAKEIAADAQKHRKEFAFISVSP